MLKSVVVLLFFKIEDGGCGGWVGGTPVEQTTNFQNRKERRREEKIAFLTLRNRHKARNS
jgi:hypothetical protein